MTADDLAINSSKSTFSDKTWSAVAVDERLDPMLEAVDAWAVALEGGLTADRRAYHQAMRATEIYWRAPMDKDLYALTQAINARVDDPQVLRTGSKVLDSFSSVVLHEHHADKYADSHGITIYAPSKQIQSREYDEFLTLDLATETRWDEFLASYLKVT